MHRMDYFGPMVNCSARINSSALLGGQIMCSLDIIREINAGYTTRPDKHARRQTILFPIVHTYDAFLPRSLKTYSFTHLESNVVNNVQQKQKRLTFGMDGSQVSVFKEGDKVSLGGFLESHHSRGLEAEIGLTSHEVSVSHKAMTSNNTP